MANRSDGNARRNGWAAIASGFLFEMEAILTS